MTCIAAASRRGKIVIGADSAGVSVSNLHIEPRTDSKVFTRTDESGEVWGFGFTGSFRMGDLLRYKLDLPEVRPKQDLREFMVTRFIDATRKALSEGGYRTKHDEVEYGGTFLVAFRGEIFKIEDDFQVGQMAVPYAAVGCGYHLALGAMFALTVWEGSGPDAQALTNVALAAAEKFSAGVRGPFHFVTMDAPVLVSGPGSTGAPEKPQAGA